MDKDKLKLLKNYNILFAEDEDGLRDEIADTLKFLFKTVYCAKDGFQAKEMYDKHKIDIIISDIKMPKVTGLEFIQYVRQKDSEVFVCIISAYTDVKFMLPFTELNLLRYIVKPITKTKLFEVFDKFIEKVNDANLVMLNDEYIYKKNLLLIQVQDQEFKLTVKEAKFLTLLLKKKSIITYYEIEGILENDNYESQNHIRQFIKKLRLKLPKKYLYNIQNEGYCISSPYLDTIKT